MAGEQAYRLGGDEFVLLMPGAEPTAGTALATSATAALAEPGLFGPRPDGSYLVGVRRAGAGRNDTFVPEQDLTVVMPDTGTPTPPGAGIVTGLLLTASAGVATAPAGRGDPLDLLRRADQTLLLGRRADSQDRPE